MNVVATTIITAVVILVLGLILISLSPSVDILDPLHKSVEMQRISTDCLRYCNSGSDSYFTSSINFEGQKETCFTLRMRGILPECDNSRIKTRYNQIVQAIPVYMRSVSSS